MNFKKIGISVVLTLAVLAGPSCKKNQETSTPYLTGNITIQGLEAFMDASYPSTRTLRLKPVGAVHPEGKEMGYYWKVSPLMDTNDTTRYENGLDKNGNPSDGTFNYVLKDSLGTFTIYCYAYAEGYTGTYAVGYTTLVKSGFNGSITDSGIYDDTKELEGTPYNYLLMGNQEWINSNIYESGAGAPYWNAEPMSGVFGHFYTYEEAKDVCSKLPGGGWRLPSDSDWVQLVEWLARGNDKAPEIKELENIFWDKEDNGAPTIAAQLMTNAKFNSEIMWEYWPEVGDITNRSGLAFIPVGYANLGVTPSVKSSTRYPNAIFEGLYEYAAFWTSNEVEGEEDMAYYRYVTVGKPHFMIGKAHKNTFGASVRCVRDFK